MAQKILKQTVKQFLQNIEPTSTLLVYSPTTIKKSFDSGCLSIKDISQFSTKIEVSNSHRVSYDTLDAISLEGIETCIGFGGGTALDVAKYVSYHKPNSKCVMIPSMLSTNVFATNKVAAIREGKKSTEDAKLPEIIVYDEQVLNFSKQQNLYGLTDALSIYTALFDWQVASAHNEEPIDFEVFNRAKEILAFALDVVNNPNTKDIFTILQQAGYITNDYGSGRPESGSEHIIAKEIEQLISIPHALAVACGIAITSQLQDNYKLATAPLKQIGIFQKIKTSILPITLKEALNRVKPREDRYTVLNEFCPLDMRIPELISRSDLYG